MSNQYYIQRNDKVRGPFSDEKLRELQAQGKLRDTDLVSTRSDGGWKPMASVLRQPPKSGTPSSGRQISKSGSRKPLWIATSIGVTLIGVVGGWLAFRGGESPNDSGISEPAAPQQALASAATIANEPIAKPLVRVEFGGVIGISIGWVSNKELLRDQRKSPDTAEFPQGTASQLVVSDIQIDSFEGWPLYPTLEFPDADQTAQPFLKDHAVKQDFTPADFSAVRSDVLVTKVFYLASVPNSATASIAAGIADLRCETVASTELTQGEDPVAAAQQRGTVLGIFRMGNKQRNLDAPRALAPRASFDARSTLPESVPPYTSSPQNREPVQFIFDGQPGAAVGWVSDKKLFRNQRFIPGRADIPQRFTT